MTSCKCEGTGWVYIPTRVGRCVPDVARVACNCAAGLKVARRAAAARALASGDTARAEAVAKEGQRS